MNGPLLRRPIKRWAPLFILPVFAAFCIGFVWPFIQGIYLSCCNFVTPSDAKWIGIQNYVKIWSDVGFRNAFKNTAAFAVVTIILINVIAFAIAYALTQKMRGANLFRTVFFMPNLIGGVVLGYVWSMIFDGILRRYATYLTANATYGFWGLIILVAWQQIGYMMIITSPACRRYRRICWKRRASTAQTAARRSSRSSFRTSCRPSRPAPS